MFFLCFTYVVLYLDMIWNLNNCPVERECVHKHIKLIFKKSRDGWGVDSSSFKYGHLKISMVWFNVFFLKKYVLDMEYVYRACSWFDLFKELSSTEHDETFDFWSP